MFAAQKVFIVGDVNQAIYGFRGAKSANMLNIPFGPRSKKFNLIDKYLTHSFRFDQEIASAVSFAPP